MIYAHLDPDTDVLHVAKAIHGEVPDGWTEHATVAAAYRAHGLEVPADVAAGALTSLVAQLGPEAVIRSAILGADLARNAGTLWDAVAAMPAASDARPALDVVLTSAITAATTDLTPTEEPTP